MKIVRAKIEPLINTDRDLEVVYIANFKFVGEILKIETIEPVF